MNISAQKMPLIAASVTGGAVGIGVDLGLSKLYTKKTGKTAGAPASLVHVYTNDKLDKKAKLDVLKEQTIEQGKDSLKLLGASTVAAGAAAIATGCSPKAQGAFTAMKNGVKEFTDNVLLKNGIENTTKSLTEVIKNNKVFQKFNGLTTPAKAAILAGAAVLALAAPIVGMANSQKMGYIEGKHESK